MVYELINWQNYKVVENFTIVDALSMVLSFAVIAISLVCLMQVTVLLVCLGQSVLKFKILQ